MEALAKTTTRKKRYQGKSWMEKRTTKKELDRKRDKSRVNIGVAFSRWRELRKVRGCKSDAEVATFLLDRLASSLQSHGPANETSRGHPPLTKEDAPDLAPHNVCVNITCLLKLFLQCGRCSGQCVVRKQGDKVFTVIQHCQICNQLTTWTSQPFKEEEESAHRCVVTDINRELTASLVMRESLGVRTDTASSREDSLLSDEDIKIIIPEEAAEPEETVVLPGEGREGDQESAASMTTMRTHQGTAEAQQSENKSDPFAEVELIIDSDFSDASQRSQEDSDGGEEAEEEEEEEDEDGGVEDKSIEKEEEAENIASSQEESLLTDEDIKIIIPAEAAEPEKPVVLTGEGREGDQESAASMTMTTMWTQTDGGPRRSASLLKQEDKKEKAQQKEIKLDQFAVVELTIDSDFSEESQGSQEDIDGGEEKMEEGEEAEREGGVQVKTIEKEEEVEDTETEEADEWEMGDDDEWSEGEMDKVRKTRKRLIVDDPPGDYKRKYMMTYRRKCMVKREQKRPETLCTGCGRLYKTMSHKCDPKKKYQCPNCGVFFLTELSLSVHRNSNCSSRYQPCVFCLKPFKTREEKLTHELSHSGESPYECPECPQRFSDRFARSHHLKEHPKSYRCQTCHKEFPVLRLLYRHEMSHSANKPFKCEVCDREFAQASQLKSHMRVHTGEKPFHCQLCPKRFNHNISLKNHLRRYHQGEGLDYPALRVQGQGFHGPGPEAYDGAELERVQGREMQESRSQEQEDVSFWTEFITQRGNSEGAVHGGQWLPAYPEAGSQEEDSQGTLKDPDPDFDPQRERIQNKRRGRGRGGGGRGRGRGRCK